MTSEVAVLNKTAVALAADSKVTVASTDHQKTYDTVNKLFTLSKSEPIGVMVYGNAEFMEFPWETIVKQYRADREGYYCDTVGDYGDDFVAYLTEFFSFDSDDGSENVRRILASWYRQIFRSLRSKMHEIGGALKEEQAIEAFEEVLNLFSSQVDAYEKWTDGRSTSQANLRRLYGDVIAEQIKEEFGRWATPKQSRRLTSLSVKLLTKHMYSRLYSGVVIAGFGNEELFPSLVSFRTDGVIAGKLKFEWVHKQNLSRESLGGIIPFAQYDMVYRFMEGVDPDYSEYLTGVFETLFHEQAVGIVERYVEGSKAELAKVRREVTKEVSASFQEALRELEEYRSKNFAGKITDTVVMLPKEELANLAESLVSLTSMQHRVATDVESVGGPIDVAVISKGDGFIWLRRKHYFDRELNPHFCRNYFRDVTLERG